MRSITAAAILSVTALLGACSKPIEYAGDGRLIDYGLTAADHRYVIEVGRVDLRRAGSTTFKLAGLPRTYFVIGLQIAVRADQPSSTNAETPANVSLELVKDHGEMVALITAPLRDWTWSRSNQADSAFAYLRQSRSYFDAFPEVHYELHVVVNTPDPSIPAGALAVLKSAGWR